MFIIPESGSGAYSVEMEGIVITLLQRCQKVFQSGQTNQKRKAQKN